MPKKDRPLCRLTLMPGTTTALASTGDTRARAVMAMSESRASASSG